ncbi:MAG: flagella basal body P-ring formation protein FlgA [Betaproteobacteria bacterium]|nr:flagella basal body P-ring formation protein FlgA [Betaproteobacteria bacterium]
MLDWVFKVTEMSKLPHPKTVTKQISYRKILRRWLWMTLAVLSLPAWSSPAMAQTPAPSATAAPDAATQSLLAAARSWVAKRQSAPENQFQASVLDPRVTAQPCAQSFQMDTPFPNPETVRVRCTQPAWQVYVRVVAALPPSAGAAPVSSSTPVSPPSPNAAAMAPGNTPLAPPKTRPVVVVNADLMRGTALQESHLSVVEWPESQVNGRVYADVKEVVNQELLRDLRPGMPVRPYDVRPVLLVRRGETVTLSISQGPGVVISAQVEAMQDGKLGDQIRLKNRDSGRIISGVVRGANVVAGL